MALIELRNASYAYDGRIALRQVSLDIESGETVVLQGPNGCGKSTLLKMVNGLLFPEEGSYSFDGQRVDAGSMRDSAFSRRLHQRIGFVFQDPDVQLFCGSVRAEIEFGPLQMGLGEEEVRRRTDDVLELLGIRDLEDRAPYNLSGGEKKKVAIACTLSLNPEVLTFDEPLAGLDKKSQRWLTDFMKDLKAAGKTIILSTHDDRLAAELAGRIVELDENHMVAADRHSSSV